MPSFATHKKSISPSKSTHSHYIFILHIIRHLLHHPLEFVVLLTALIVSMASTARDNHLPLRKAVALLLLDAKVSQSTTTSFKQLVPPLRIVSGITDEDDVYVSVSHSLLVSAFNRGKDDREYIVTFEELGITSEEIRTINKDDRNSPKEHLLLVRVRIGARRNTSTKDDYHYEVCHLINSDEGKREVHRNNSTEYQPIQYKGNENYKALFVPPLGAHTSRMAAHPLTPPYNGSNNITEQMQEDLQTYLSETKTRSILNQQQSTSTSSNVITPKAVAKKKRGSNQNRSTGGQFGKKKGEEKEEPKDTTTKSPMKKKGKKGRPGSASNNNSPPINNNKKMFDRMNEVELIDRKNRLQKLLQQLQQKVEGIQKEVVDLGIKMTVNVQEAIPLQTEYDELLQHQQSQTQPPVDSNINNSNSDNTTSSQPTLPSNEDDDAIMEDVSATTRGTSTSDKESHPPAIDNSKHPSDNWDWSKNDTTGVFPLTYTMANGRVGRLLNNNVKNGVIFVKQLYDNLFDVPEGKDSAADDRTRANKPMKIETNGATQHLIPSNTTIVMNKDLSELEKAEKIVKKLKRIFSGKQSSFSEESQAIMTAFNITGYGCSDEATSMIQCGAWLALLNEIELEIKAVDIANACPSARSLARWELLLATDCMAMAVEEMKSDMEASGMKYCGIISDHGQRGKQDHFVVIVVWAGLDDDGNKTLKFFCPSIDSAGHSTAEAANGVKTVLDRLLHGTDIEAHVITGDAGGGGAVQHLYKKLVDMGIMDKNCKEANCSLHGLQKALENASKKTMGDQGMGCRSPFQMLYLFASLMGYLKEDRGLQHLDKMWSKVSEQLQNNEEWTSIGQEMMMQAWTEFINTVEAVQLEDGDEDALSNLEKRLSKAPREIQDPVWTRWASVSQSKSSIILYEHMIFWYPSMNNEWYPFFEELNLCTSLFLSSLLFVYYHHRLLKHVKYFLTTTLKSTS